MIDLKTLSGKGVLGLKAARALGRIDAGKDFDDYAEPLMADLMDDRWDSVDENLNLNANGCDND